MPPPKIFNTETLEPGAPIPVDKLKPTAWMELLVGGPYSKDGKEHRYGHTAILVRYSGGERVYDFGRYRTIYPEKINLGITTVNLDGDSSPRGEGILKIWTSFARYIASENALGRATVGYGYTIMESQAQLIVKHFLAMTRDIEPYERNAVHQRFKTRTEYFALGPNCTTVSIEGAQQAVPNIVLGSEKYIKTDGILGQDAMLGMKVQGYKVPSNLFLPANLGSYLEGAPAIKVDKRTVYKS
jgi:hypothetical protein